MITYPHLPSLPAIAAQVLELTSLPDVPIRDIARVVQNDQALAGKILKTVNSSFYGLGSPCPSIERAMSYLGLNTVKSLILGFSFIDSFDGLPGEAGSAQTGFSLTAHWRRAIYGAAAAKTIAQTVQTVDADEAFLAALMQDVGMLAMFVAFKEEYAQALLACAHDNELVVGREQEVFGFTHLEVGARLAEKWRLPASIIESARHHHDPAGAPEAHASFVRCAGLASLMASAAANEACERDILVYAQRAKAWFELDREEAEQMLQAAVDGAVELSGLFEVETGGRPDLGGLLVRASDALVEHQIASHREAERFEKEAYTDGLTGIANRKRFDQLLREGFGHAIETSAPIGLLFCDADRFKQLNDTHGHQAGDAILIDLAARLTHAVGACGTVCRYGGEEFAAILPGLNAEQAAGVAERCRAAVESALFDLRGVQCEADELPVTISVGVASREAQSGAVVRTSDLLLRAADKALYAAKAGGRNCVRMIRLKSQTTAPPGVPADLPLHLAADRDVRQPARRPAAAAPFRILLVEDDPLQQKLVSLPLSKQDGYIVETASDGGAAIASIDARADAGPCERYDLILLDIGLPDIPGVEVVRHIRSSSHHCTAPIVVLSASDEEQDIRNCLLAGANAYITKQSIRDDPRSRILSIVSFWRHTFQAA